MRALRPLAWSFSALTAAVGSAFVPAVTPCSTPAASMPQGASRAPRQFLPVGVLRLAHCEAVITPDAVMGKYNELCERLRDVERLEGINGLLGWDQQVLMPDGASDSRNSQKALLAKVAYGMKTSPELQALIDTLTAVSSSLPSAYERAVVRDAKRDMELEKRMTKEMKTQEAELEGRGYGVWVKARTNHNFGEFEPVLSEIIALKKQIAAVTRPNLSVYDGCVDMFERGMKAKRLEDVFVQVKQNVVPLLASILSVKAQQKFDVPESLKGGENWNTDAQKALCAEIAEAIGFDFSRGRLDVSVHPFTGGAGPTDVRITTRYSTENWLEGIAGTVHEVGHALYEQGRSMAYADLPVNRALSMGMHESQSLFWERMIFQSREFWDWATPLFHKHFPHTLQCTAEDFYKVVNLVEPGYIRVEADEVSYPLHVILRFELEKALFDDGLPPHELPREWNQKMKDTLQLEVQTDSQGVLQDVHWSCGAFGYFPSYTLGAIIAAQLFESIEKDIPDVRAKISRGEFKPIRDWLRERVHRVGSLYASPDELLVQVTGKPMDPSVYVGYLQRKYATLYGL